MFRSAAVFLISSIGFTVSATQSINISGTVINKKGNPIKGAIVSLAGQKSLKKDTTDAQGKYLISNATFLVTPTPILPSVEKISLINGMIVLNLTKPAPVKIEMFDMKGNLLDKVLNHPKSAGDYRFDMVTHPLAANMMIIRASIGARTSTLRYLPLNICRRTIASSNAAYSTGGRLAKTQAAIDTLKVLHSNYISTDTAISSYQGEVNITLDSIELAKFSFFVTSLKGLQTLSGSDKGFGGDLRFGKTGQGAGLLGADSICSCLAERSMKGASAKQWRAFLSVAKGPDGTQVNAIDRIGTGPWYDRRGRVVANKLSDLLNDRPSSADPAIKNDLPNEDGIPNRSPEGTRVDNHLTITGSGTNGKLYSSNSTCNDWTATTGKGGSKPRSGMSWPQDFGGFGGMKNWISVWDQSGCEAGTDLTDASMGGLPNVYTIGNGGGYGGFYCFALIP
ncbi:MAG: carboxypeptidase regulatory-like domain-containing protein [Chitinispirillaceae bacterium]|nr:carboxypeptidase regulatory-like domain-containing protein [Chitinispirillaceae bacterium]